MENSKELMNVQWNIRLVSLINRVVWFVGILER